jgi:ribonuclease HI
VVCSMIAVQSRSRKYSNNIAKYEAILLGLCKLRVVGVQHYTLKIDSGVVASQIEKECNTREETLERYLHTIRRMETFFKGFTIEHIERAKNIEADEENNIEAGELAKAAARKVELPPNVFFQIIKDPSIKTVEPEPRMINVV